MQIDVKDIGHFEGQDVWICDYRRPDKTKKPIRKVAPTKVQVRPSSEAKKTAYYSHYFFKPYAKSGKLSSTEIKPFDNTGFRSFTGNPVYIFDNEDECNQQWNSLIQSEISYWKNKSTTILQEINNTIDDYQSQLK